MRWFQGCVSAAVVVAMSAASGAALAKPAAAKPVAAAKVSVPLVMLKAGVPFW